MKDHVKIGHLTKYVALWVNRDQVMNLEIRFKIHTNVSNFDKASPKTIYPVNSKIVFISLVTTVKSRHVPTIIFERSCDENRYVCPF